MMVSIRRLAILALCGCALLPTGCGAGLVPVPEDCIVFDRSEARGWVAFALAEKADGETELEVFAEVLRRCLDNNCDGSSGGACAVSCTACTDAIINNTFD